VPGAERRLSARHEPGQGHGCHLSPIHRGKLIPARLLNVSAEGVGLHCAQRFERGELVGVHLESATGTYARFSLLRLRHTAVHPAGGYVLGGELIHPLSERELRLLFAVAS
jgi:hypothetical protein